MIQEGSCLTKRADYARTIPLIDVLFRVGAKRDKHDGAKWLTSASIVSVTGQKFFNWSRNTGGGGAIDLVMHIHGFRFHQALVWLEDNFNCSNTPLVQIRRRVPLPQFIPPKRDSSKMSPVVQYLNLQRCIPDKIIRILIKSGRFYADNHQNAVCLLLGKEKKAVGAELIGTTSVGWRGLARGSRKNLGCFYFKTGIPNHIVICESAIDAISYCSLYTNCMALSTSGATSHPAWLPTILKHPMQVYCGFDNDKTGEQMANLMIQKHTEIRRLKPDKKDWNEDLKSSIYLPS